MLDARVIDQNILHPDWPEFEMILKMHLFAII